MNKSLDEISVSLAEVFKIIENEPPPARSEGAKVDLRRLWQLTAGVFDILSDENFKTLDYVLAAAKEAPDFAKSAVSTALLAGAIAREKNPDEQKIMEIIAAALFHDTGMLRVPELIRQNTSELKESELKIIKNHPVLSYKIIKQELFYSDEVAVLALQHHERWDGSGYPHGLAGANIKTGAQILGIADTFCAMLRKKSYKDALLAYNAMKSLLSGSEIHFSANVLQSALKIIGHYPTGSGVILNDGRAARVHSQNGAPLRPVVRIAGGAELVDLSIQKNIYIMRALDI